MDVCSSVLAVSQSVFRCRWWEAGLNYYPPVVIKHPPREGLYSSASRPTGIQAEPSLLINEMINLRGGATRTLRLGNLICPAIKYCGLNGAIENSPDAETHASR